MVQRTGVRFPPPPPQVYWIWPLVIVGLNRKLGEGNPSVRSSILLMGESGFDEGLEVSGESVAPVIVQNLNINANDDVYQLAA